jgi:hypothetical protein
MGFVQKKKIMPTVLYTCWMFHLCMSDCFLMMFNVSAVSKSCDEYCMSSGKTETESIASLIVTVMLQLTVSCGTILLSYLLHSSG